MMAQRFFPACVLLSLVSGALKDLMGDLGLELLESSSTSPWNGMAMRNRDGESYRCVAGEARRPGEEAQGPRTLRGALDQLRGSCAYLNKGWWTYEWCHRLHVRQFHLEASARNPEWSLGDYTRTEVGKASDGDDDDDDDGAPGGAPYGADEPVDEDLGSLGPDALSRAVDVFDSGGQRCDETGSSRKSVVHFRCCDGTRAKSSAPQKRSEGRADAREASAQATSGPPAAFITSVEEVALCSYSLAVSSRVGKGCRAVEARSRGLIWIDPQRLDREVAPHHDSRERVVIWRALRSVSSGSLSRDASPRYSRGVLSSRYRKMDAFC